MYNFNCISCPPGRLTFLPNCPCPPGYFDIVGIEECSKCDFQCLTCYGIKTKCLNCRGDRIGDSCLCPYGTYDDGISEECIPCDF